MLDTHPMQMVELVETHKESDELLKLNLNDAIMKNKEWQYHIMLLEYQLWGLEEKTNESMHQQSNLDILVSQVKSLTMSKEVR